MQYLCSTGPNSTQEAKCIEEEIEPCAEAEKLRERDWGVLWRHLNDGGCGSGIVPLLFVGGVLGLFEGEPLLLDLLGTLLLVRYRGCSGHGGGGREQVWNKSKCWGKTSVVI